MIASPALYSGAVSRLRPVPFGRGLRRPFFSDRYFFATVRLLKERAKLVDADFHGLVLACGRVHVMHLLFLTAWVLLPGHGHALCARACPLTISLVMKSLPAAKKIPLRRVHPSLSG